MRTVYIMVAQMQSGKDTFGAFLAEATGAKLVSFADPVKAIAMELLAMPRDVAYGGEKARRSWKRYGKDAREWLQYIGTEFGRQQVDDSVWIDRLCDKIRCCLAPSFVITDGRFKNEILSLEERLGEDYLVVRVRLTRDGYENKLSHASEAEQMELPDSVFHEVVRNDGTLEELEQKARAIAAKHRSDQ